MLSKMRTFTPDDVCALGHGDLGRDLAWPLSWKTLCLHLNVSAQMSGLELRRASLGKRALL